MHLAVACAGSRRGTAPLWQVAGQRWLPHGSGRLQSSSQGSQSPGQHLRLQACLPQVRTLPQRLSHLPPQPPFTHITISQLTSC